MNSQITDEKKVFHQLEELCNQPGYIYAIAFICYRDNAVFYSGEMKAEDFSKLYNHGRLIRSEISTLIGLMIKGQVNTYFPGDDIIYGYVEETDFLLLEMHNSMMKSGFTRTEKDKGKQSDGLSFIREPIFYSGESAYDFQYIELSAKKYKNDNAWIENNKNFTLNELESVFKCIEFNLTLNGNILFDLYKSDNKIGSNVFLSANKLSIVELSNISNISKEKITSILDEFSCKPNSNQSFLNISDFNEYNAFPILKKDNDYFVFQYYSLAQAFYETPFFWLHGDKKYQSTASSNRGEFVEQFTFDKVKNVFGEGAVYKNVIIMNHRKETLGEIDVLIVFSNCAVIFQAKSKKLTIDARKGNDKAIQNDFKSAIQDAYDQGLSCANLLLNDKLIILDESFNKIHLNIKFNRIYIIPIVSEHYPAISFQARQFLKFEETEIIATPFVMDVFALDIISEFLNTPLYFLYYLERRTSYGNKIFSSHELTVLSYHLKNNLWFDNDVDMMMLNDDLCSDLDLAMIARRKGVPGAKTPRGILTLHKDSFVMNLIKNLERTENKIALDLGFLLLSLGSEAIDDLDKITNQTIMKTKYDQKHHDATAMFSGVGLTIHSNYEPIINAERKLINHCEKRKYITKAKKWFGIIIHPENLEVRKGVLLDFDWEFSGVMEKVIPRSLYQNAYVNRGNGLTKVKKIGRNDSCPCGSGQKYKKCCRI